MAVSLIDWLTSLPQQPLIDGYSEEPAGKKIRTSMDAAIAKQRNRFTTSAQPFTAVFLMTLTQYSNFKAFYDTTLVNGVKEFNMQVTGDPLTTHVVRFTEKGYNPEFIGLYVRVNCNLEVIP